MNWWHELKFRSAVKNIRRISEEELNDLMVLLIQKEVDTNDLIFTSVWDEVVMRYNNPLISYAKYGCGDMDDASDIVQESLIDAWKNVLKYDSSRGSLKVWLYVKTKNALSNHHRNNQSRSKRESAHSLPSGIGSVEKQAEANAFIADVLECADTCLNDAQREVWIEVIMEGKTCAELTRQAREGGKQVSDQAMYGQFGRADTQMKKCLRAKGHRM